MSPNGLQSEAVLSAVRLITADIARHCGLPVEETLDRFPVLGDEDTCACLPYIPLRDDMSALIMIGPADWDEPCRDVPRLRWCIIDAAETITAPEGLSWSSRRDQVAEWLTAWANGDAARATEVEEAVAIEHQAHLATAKVAELCGLAWDYGVEPNQGGQFDGHTRTITGWGEEPLAMVILDPEHDPDPAAREVPAGHWAIMGSGPHPVSMSGLHYTAPASAVLAWLSEWLPVEHRPNVERRRREEQDAQTTLTEVWSTLDALAAASRRHDALGYAAALERAQRMSITPEQIADAWHWGWHGSRMSRPPFDAAGRAA